MGEEEHASADEKSRFASTDIIGLMGFGLSTGWLFALLFSNHAGSDPEEFALLRLVGLVSMVVCHFAYRKIADSISDRKNRRAVIVVTACLGSVLPLCQVVACFMPVPAFLAAVCWCAFGAAAPLSIAIWSEYFSLLERDLAPTASAASYAIAGCWFLASENLSSPWCQASPIAALLLSCVFYLLFSRESGAPELIPVKEGRERLTLTWDTGIVRVCFGFAFGFLLLAFLATPQSFNGTLLFGASMLLCCLLQVAVLFATKKRGYPYELTLRVVFICLALALLFAIAPPEQLVIVVAAVVFVGFVFIDMSG